MTTSTRRPAATPLLLPLLAAVLAAVLATSGCSFRGDVTQGASSASRPAATTSATSPASTPVGTATSMGAGTAAGTATRTPSTSSAGTPPAGSPTRRTSTTAATTAATTAGTTALTTAPAAGSGAAPACRTADLQVSIGGGEGTAGSVSTAVELVNTGTTTCVLSGHPGVSFVAGEDGHQVGASAAREGSDLSPAVLAPGARASAPLRIAGAGAFDAASCRPTPVNGFRVYPPDQRASAFVPRPGTACASSSTPQLTVGTVRSGAAAS